MQHAPLCSINVNNLHAAHNTKTEAKRKQDKLVSLCGNEVNLPWHIPSSSLQPAPLYALVHERNVHKAHNTRQKQKAKKRREEGLVSLRCNEINLPSHIPSSSLQPAPLCALVHERNAMHKAHNTRQKQKAKKRREEGLVSLRCNEINLPSHIPSSKRAPLCALVHEHNVLDAHNTTTKTAEGKMVWLVNVAKELTNHHTHHLATCSALAMM